MPINTAFPGSENIFKPTIFIVDDDSFLLEALGALLESLELNVKCYDNSMSFLEAYDPNLYHSGCIILDVRMPNMSGIQLLEKLNSLKNTLPIIVLSGYGDIPMAVNAMKMGAIDFIAKPFDSQHLIEQIQIAITEHANQQLTTPTENYANQFLSLTKREMQIMKLVTLGKLNKEIAQELFISISTVEFHRSRIMKKMGAKNLAQLVKMSLAL